MLAIRVDAQGKVVEVTPLDATHPDFVDAAVTAVARRQYEIPTKNGRPVGFRAVVSSRFDPHYEGWF